MEFKDWTRRCSLNVLLEVPDEATVTELKKGKHKDNSLTKGRSQEDVRGLGIHTDLALR